MARASDLSLDCELVRVPGRGKVRGGAWYDPVPKTSRVRRGESQQSTRQPDAGWRIHFRGGSFAPSPQSGENVNLYQMFGQMGTKSTYTQVRRLAQT
jgi:hypothetical protein